MLVKILCGVSGSGKTTYVNNLSGKIEVVSADHFFYDNEGEYKFDISLLSKAHNSCLRNFVSSVVGHSNDKILVVDNTNTTVVEIVPYAALALAYGQDLEIVIFDVSRENLTKIANRNVHGVPEQIVEGQFNRLEGLKKQLPLWWPVKTIKVEM